MDIWKMLGIPPTNDIGEIKSAYAKQAKIYHPEEHPEEFKALQSAYKTALQIAKRKGQGPSIIYVPPTPGAGQIYDVSREKSEPEQMEDAFEEEAKSERMESFSSEESQPEHDKDAAGAKQEPEHTFDYSDVDAYGDRERFFKQFFLLKKNPYLKNNLEAWDYFLNLDEYQRLFAGASFRMNFVRTVCGEFGWRRKTIVYFKRHLTKFHTKENVPVGGKRETKFFWFRMKQLPWPKLPAILTDRYWGEEGKKFQRYLQSHVGDAIGHEMDLKNRADLIKYIEFYLSYGEVKEAYITHLRDDQSSRQTLVTSIIIVFCIFAVLTGKHSIEVRQENKELLRRIDYITQLYGLEPDAYTEEEQKQIVKEYDMYWRYAEDAIDDVLMRSEDWTKQE